jgi:hypothetical protein
MTRKRDRELQRHYEAGAADERAAEIEELAVREGLGDVAAHQRAAERQRKPRGGTWQQPSNPTNKTPDSPGRSRSCYTL